MSYKNINNKSEILFDITNSKEKKEVRIQKLLKYLNDPSPSIRNEAVFRLNYSFNKFLNPRDLLPAIYDSHQRNAIEVIKILTFELNFFDKKIFDRSLEILKELKMINWPNGCDLIEVLEDYPKLVTWDKISFIFDYPQFIVRGYAYMLIESFPKYKPKLYEFLKKEKSERAKFDIYLALYTLGDKKYFKDFLQLILDIETEECQEAGIAILGRYITKSNFRTILDFLNKNKSKFTKFGKKFANSNIELIHKDFGKLLANPEAGKGL